VSARTSDVARAPSRGIPLAALIAGVAPSPRVSAEAAAHEIARGLAEAGAAEPGLCPLQQNAGRAPRELLDSIGFDARMRSARALVILDGCLSPGTLAPSLTFELATRARQAGVPAYAVTGENLLDGFAARILDLQLIIQARSREGLRAAGRRLAEVL
jgi:glycerate kinase